MVDVSYFSDVEVEANLKLQERLREEMKPFKTEVWIFDLATKKWKSVLR